MKYLRYYLWIICLFYYFPQLLIELRIYPVFSFCFSFYLYFFYNFIRYRQIYVRIQRTPHIRNTKKMRTSVTRLPFFHSDSNILYHFSFSFSSLKYSFKASFTAHFTIPYRTTIIIRTPINPNANQSICPLHLLYYFLLLVLNISFTTALFLILLFCAPSFKIPWTFFYENAIKRNKDGNNCKSS